MNEATLTAGELVERFRHNVPSTMTKKEIMKELKVLTEAMPEFINRETAPELFTLEAEKFFAGQIKVMDVILGKSNTKERVEKMQRDIRAEVDAKRKERLIHFLFSSKESFEDSMEHAIFVDGFRGGFRMAMELAKDAKTSNREADTAMANSKAYKRFLKEEF